MPEQSPRSAWIQQLERLFQPLLTAAAQRTLRQHMPVEGQPDRTAVSHLEAVGRGLAGLAPWLAVEVSDPAERELQARMRQQAIAAVSGQVDPQSPDAAAFDGSAGKQPLVDSAFLAHALLRAPSILIDGLSDQQRKHVVQALVATRAIMPYRSNWLLFAAMVEAALDRLGHPIDHARVNDALVNHAQWYVGDGTYGDGPEYHADFYNSFVIQPMLLDVLAELGHHDPTWAAMVPAVTQRATRYAAIQERMIGVDGSWPVLGRSIVYRCGAFQHLAQCALQGLLPDNLPPAQVRCALAAAITRCLDAPGTYDAQGWLTIGLCGHQPGLGERYISTGSLYLASLAFLPLGLTADHPFWSDPDEAWTSQRVWLLHQDLAADRALK